MKLSTKKILFNSLSFALILFIGVAFMQLISFQLDLNIMTYKAAFTTDMNAAQLVNILQNQIYTVYTFIGFAAYALVLSMNQAATTQTAINTIFLARK